MTSVLPICELEPAGQSAQALAALAFEYFPTGQLVQAGDPVKANLPESQTKHTAALADVVLLTP